MESSEDNKFLDNFSRKRLSQIPCFKHSFLNGILSGIGGGLIYFMFTSKVQMSMHVSVATYFTVTMSYWTYCRYNWNKNKKSLDMLAAYMAAEDTNPIKDGVDV